MAVRTLPQGPRGSGTKNTQKNNLNVHVPSPRQKKRIVFRSLPWELAAPQTPASCGRAGDPRMRRGVWGRQLPNGGREEAKLEPEAT